MLLGRIPAIRQVIQLPQQRVRFLTVRIKLKGSSGSMRRAGASGSSGVDRVAPVRSAGAEASDFATASSGAAAFVAVASSPGALASPAVVAWVAVASSLVAAAASFEVGASLAKSGQGRKDAVDRFELVEADGSQIKATLTADSIKCGFKYARQSTSSSSSKMELSVAVADAAHPQSLFLLISATVQAATLN